MDNLNLTIDARKLGDGGIGVYLENLIEGLFELKEKGLMNLNLSLLVAPKVFSENSNQHSYVKSLQERKIKLIKESAKPYSLSEYFFLAWRHKKHLAAQDLFHSPHYVLPFFIKTPKVVTVHDLIHVDHPDTFWHKPIAQTLIKSAAKRVNAIITVSKYSKSRLSELIGSSEKIHVVYNALQKSIGILSADKRNKSLHSGTSSFLFVGSDRPHKRFSVMLSAWKGFISTCEKDAVLFVVGKCYGPKTKKLVNELGLARSIHFLGAVSNSELNELYNAVNAAVITSRDEGFGLVALEALSCGTSVVSTPLLSVKEFTGECGVIFSEDFSSSAITKALVVAVERVKEKKFERINTSLFSRENLARSTVEIYETVLSKKLLSSSESKKPIFKDKLSANLGSRL